MAAFVTSTFRIKPLLFNILYVGHINVEVNLKTKVKSYILFALMWTLSSTYVKGKTFNPVLAMMIQTVGNNIFQVMFLFSFPTILLFFTPYYCIC